MITFSGPFFDLSLPTPTQEREALLLQAVEYDRLIEAKIKTEDANSASVTESLAAFGL